MFSARTLFYMEAVAKAITISLFRLSHLSIVVAFIKIRLLIMVTIIGRSVEEAIISSTRNILEETSQEHGHVDI